MTDWFEKNQNNTPDTAADTDNGSSTSYEKQTASGWSSPSSSVVPPNSWSSTSSGTTPSQPDGATPSHSNGTADNSNNVTYRYGVNAPNPVPSNETDSSRGGGTSNVSGGYQPQGNYSPYGWQPSISSSGGAPAPGQPPKKPKKKKGAAIAIATLSVACVALIVTLSVLLAVAINGNELPTTGNSSTNTSSATNPTRGVNENAPSLDIQDPDETEGLSTRAIVQKNVDSTVVITMYNRSNYYLGDNSQLTQAGSASGIIWTADGYIITNCHVVYNEDSGKLYDRVDVELYDGTVYEGAEVVGYDQYTDLAVIKIDATGLTPAEFGDSSQLQLGDKVVAIGNAGGLNWTVTQGIVSGLARDVYEDTGYAIKCLQVDAAINPGNSGGPLMNSQGQVVAINSAKIAASGYEGLGFSIPINEAKEILDDLVKYGYVKGRVMLGITGRSLNGIGFRIEAINSDSCLAGTEAQVGDIITAVDGVAVVDYESMRTELSKHSVGDSVELTLLRYDSRTHSNRELTVKCVLAESTN